MQLPLQSGIIRSKSKVMFIIQKVLDYRLQKLAQTHSVVNRWPRSGIFSTNFITYRAIGDLHSTTFNRSEIFFYFRADWNFFSGVCWEIWVDLLATLLASNSICTEALVNLFSRSWDFPATVQLLQRAPEKLSWMFLTLFSWFCMLIQK